MAHLYIEVAHKRARSRPSGQVAADPVSYVHYTDDLRVPWPNQIAACALQRMAWFSESS